MFLIEWMFWRLTRKGANDPNVAAPAQPRTMDWRKALAMGAMVGRWTHYHDKR